MFSYIYIYINSRNATSDLCINNSLYLCNSLAYQRMSWEALKKSINGLVNKVNVSNIENIIHELLQENIVRGR